MRRTMESVGRRAVTQKWSPLDRAMYRLPAALVTLPGGVASGEADGSPKLMPDDGEGRAATGAAGGVAEMRAT